MQQNNQNNNLAVLNVLLKSVDYDNDGVIGPDDILKIFKNLGVTGDLNDAKMLIDNVSDYIYWRLEKSSYSGLHGIGLNMLQAFYNACNASDISSKGNLWGIEFLKMGEDNISANSIFKFANALDLSISLKDCEDAIRLWTALLTNNEYQKNQITQYGTIPNPPLELRKDLPLAVPVLSKNDFIKLFKIYK